MPETTVFNTNNNTAGPTRRELLNYAWLASLGILTVQAAGISLYFSLPRARAGEFGGLIKVDAVSELPGVDDAPVNNAEGKFWLVRTEAGLIALYKVCTHLDCLFNWNEQEQKFICPCHGSQFDREGTYLSGPAPRGLDRFVIQLVSPDGEILAETDSQTGAALPVPATGDASAEASDITIQVNTGRRILASLSA